MDSVIADTGFLVALGRQKDPYHVAATGFLAGNDLPLVTVSAVIAEACFFFTAEAKRALLDWVADGGVGVVDVPGGGYRAISATVAKYADRDIDFADAALLWLANEASLRRILTVDKGDFGAFRLKGGRRFELVDWY